MRSTLLLLALAGLVAAQEAASTPAAVPALQAGTVFVLNKGEGTASLYDRVTWKSLGKVKTGGGPHEVATSPDGRLAYVANYGDRRAPGRSISVIDVKKREVVATWESELLFRPHGVMTDPSGERLYVTSEGRQALVVFDTKKGETIGSWPTKSRASHMVALGKKRAFVANIMSGSMTALDLKSGELVRNVRTGRGAEGIWVRPGKPEVWVTNRAEDTISVMHTESLEELAKLACAAFPIRIAFTPDGKTAIVSNARSGDVTFIDAETRKESGRLKFDAKSKDSEGRLFGDTFGQSPVPIGLLALPDGKHLLVALANADVVAVVDLKTRKVVKVLETGREPDGLGFARAGG